MSADETPSQGSTDLPVRWADEPLKGSSAERRAALLFRAAIHAAGRRRIDLAAVHVKLRAAWISGETPRRRARRAGLVSFRARAIFAAVAIVLLASSFVGAAIWWHRQSRPAWLRATSREGKPNETPGRNLAERRTRSAPGVEPTLSKGVDPQVSPSPREEPVTEPAPPVPVTAVTARARAAVVPPSRATAAAWAEAHGGAQAHEQAREHEHEQAALLARGVRLLHRNQDAAGAIATLSEYRVRFPDGLFIDEAKTALAEAYLASGHDTEALSLLEEPSSATGERRRARLTLRGELRARLGHCGTAIEDFDAVLASPAREKVDERALFGRGVCHERLGHGATARDDFTAYGLRFPHGRFGDDARNRLRR